MRERVRAILTWVLSAVFGVILVAVIGEWFIEVAKEKGLYDNAGRNWDRLMGTVTGFVTSNVVLYPLVGLAGLVVGMWLDALLKLRVPESGISAGQDTAVAAVPTWLETLADDDDRQMGSRVVPDAIPMTARAFLNAVEPYVDLTFGLFNGTVFDLSVSHFDGHIKFMGHDLMHDAKIMNPKLWIAHAKHGNIVVRQYITRQTASIFSQIMADSRNPVLDVSNFSIHFRYINQKGEPKTCQMAGGNAGFLVDIQGW